MIKVIEENENKIVQLNYKDNQSKWNLKVVTTTFLLVCFIGLKKSTCETKKNVFCFALKALFILEIIIKF